MSEIPIAQSGKTEVGEGDADVDEVGVVAVSAVSLPTTSGTGDQMLTNTGEKGAVAATMEDITEVGPLVEATASREEEEDAGDTYRTPTTVMDDPLLTMGRIHSPRLRRHTPRTQHHLNQLLHRIRSPLHPLPDHLYLRLL